MHDPVYAEYWNNMEEYPDELYAANHSEALERLKIGGNFLRTSVLPLTSLVYDKHVAKTLFVKTWLIFLQVASDPELTKGMSLETVRTSVFTSMAPLTKHSPYTRLFNM